MFSLAGRGWSIHLYVLFKQTIKPELNSAFFCLNRQVASNGETENDTISEDTVSLDDKRFYYHPFTSRAFKKYVPRPNLF